MAAAFDARRNGQAGERAGDPPRAAPRWRGARPAFSVLSPLHPLSIRVKHGDALGYEVFPSGRTELRNGNGNGNGNGRRATGKHSDPEPRRLSSPRWAVPF